MNRFYPRLGQYTYFRGRATTAFADSDKVPAQVNNPVDAVAKTMELRWEGAYNAVAMIESYFSLMEHLMVFCLPFAGYAPERDNIQAFLGMNWGEKYKRVFDIQQAHGAKGHYDDLRGIRDRFRNPMSHGRYDKRGASVLVHLGFAGAVPASARVYADSIELDLTPVSSVPMIAYAEPLIDSMPGYVLTGRLRQCCT